MEIVKATNVVNPVSNLNDFRTGIALFTSGSGVTNLPNTNTWFVISGGGTDTITQVAFDFFNKIPPNTRSYANGAWGAWQRMVVDK